MTVLPVWAWLVVVVLALWAAHSAAAGGVLTDNGPDWQSMFNIVLGVLGVVLGWMLNGLHGLSYTLRCVATSGATVLVRAGVMAVRWDGT